jgi:aspartyl-tRNA(Asn)/glutamyl-tRNA(Gln) amidotransferase subunit A
MRSWTLARVAAAIRNGEASAVEATQACLNELRRLQPRLHLAVRLDDEEACAAALDSDRWLREGKPLGALHGVPLAHKDVFDRAGKPTTCGSKIRTGHVASTTAEVLRRLDREGAIDLGRLNMAEFAAGGTGHNEHWGDCANPWNPEYTPGGSSSGSAAAVAVRAVYGSLGTDTGGSLRWPAALCGITALRPTFGRLSLDGVAPRAWSLDTVGPMARTAEDCAMLFRAMAGIPVDARLEDDIKGVRIGVPRGNCWRKDVIDEHESALEQALEVFRDLGAETVEVALPPPDLAFGLGEVLAKAEAAALHGNLLRERRGDYAPGIRAQLESGLAIPATHYIDALRLRAPLLKEFLEAAFEQADVLLLPAHPFAPPKMEDCAPRSEKAVAAFWAAYPRFTRPLSYFGLPVVSLPCGFSSCAVPIGCQLVARPNEELRLLTAAHCFQKSTPWHEREPHVPA